VIAHGRIKYVETPTGLGHNSGTNHFRIDLESASGRDGRVVEGARLESDSGDAHRVIPKDLFAQLTQRVPATQYSSM
jgi:hypothetical protein